jgi:hypothetical protein
MSLGVSSIKPKDPTTQKHLISERRLAGRDGTVNQALTGAKATGFLERPITARCSVPKPMPVSVEIERQERPWARRRATSATFTETLGLPKR